MRRCWLFLEKARRQAARDFRPKLPPQLESPAISPRCWWASCEQIAHLTASFRPGLQLSTLDFTAWADIGPAVSGVEAFLPTQAHLDKLQARVLHYARRAMRGGATYEKDGHKVSISNMQ
eukprot:3643236-Pyramimonas_sp.AAC.1